MAEKLDQEIIEALEEAEVLEEAQDLWGRPTKMTNKTVALLLNAFSYSFSDEESCIYANISKNTLYRYIEKHPEFWHQKELLKKKPNIKAKMNWIEKMNNKDYQASKEWLERKSKDEFSMKSELKSDWTMTFVIKE